MSDHHPIQLTSDTLVLTVGQFLSVKIDKPMILFRINNSYLQ